MLEITSYKVRQAIKNIAIGKVLGPNLILAEILKKVIQPRDNGGKEQEQGQEQERTPFYSALTRLFNVS